MKHTIIFNKDSSYQYYNSKEPDGSEWCYNSEFVKNMMMTNELILKDRGWLYLREIYDRLGIESIPISPILGWDAYQNPKFEYKIVEHRDENSFEIILNPEELK